MDTSIHFLSAKRGGLVLPLSEGPNDAVVLELDKLKKPSVQTQQEKLNAIENLHEGVPYKAGYEDDDIDTGCAECQMPWPCATYLIIHPRIDNVSEAPF